MDPPWHWYAHTVLHFHGGPVVDLRREVAAEHIDAFTQLGLPRTFAVITACNPRDVLLTDTENAVRHRDLLRGLQERDIQWFEVTGASVDGTHREIGVAVDVALTSARTLAAAAEQTALFWFDGASFCIVGAIERVRRIRLPL